MISSNLLDEVAKYKSDTVDMGFMHISVAEENELWMNFLTDDGGTADYISKQLEASLLGKSGVKSTGIMSKSQSKNAEYGFVVGIGLITRYAVNAGAEEITAFRLSDIILQKLSEARNVSEMTEIFSEGIIAFRQLVQQGNRIGRNSFYIELAKDYIAKHIFEKILLADIAGFVGLSESYISRIFSAEMGMTIKQYIMSEKINRSCNLLVYSGQPIAVIAEYVGLSPQSYYTRIFTQVMGVTPGRYKQENRNNSFLVRS